MQTEIRRHSHEAVNDVIGEVGLPVSEGLLHGVRDLQLDLTAGQGGTAKAKQ